MARTEGNFEKGVSNGSRDALDLPATMADAWQARWFAAGFTR